MKVKALLVGMGLPLVVALSTPAAVFAHSIANGDARVANATINSNNNWREIRRVTFAIPANDSAIHDCVAMASADMQLDGTSVESRYRFALSHNDPQIATNTASERTVEMINNADNDPNSKPVATTLHFRGLTNANGEGVNQNLHRIRFLGRKWAAADDNADVLDASLTVVCVER